MEERLGALAAIQIALLGQFNDQEILYLGTPLQKGVKVPYPAE